MSFKVDSKLSFFSHINYISDKCKRNVSQFIFVENIRPLKKCKHTQMGKKKCFLLPLSCCSFCSNKTFGARNNYFLLSFSKHCFLTSLENHTAGGMLYELRKCATKKNKNPTSGTLKGSHCDWLADGESFTARRWAQWDCSGKNMSANTLSSARYHHKFWWAWHEKIKLF